MKDAVKQCWNHFQKYKNIKNEYFEIVNPSIPLLYFGDGIGYKNSRIKIITVGLNPSRNEFPLQDPFRRFRNAEKIYELNFLNEVNIKQYLSLLDNYFKNCSYDWFDAFEPILNGLNCSYYTEFALKNNFENIALHTDFCTTLTTDPTWSQIPRHRLVRAQINDIEENGINLWHDLISLLKPDVMLLSISKKKYFKKIRFRLIQDWVQIYKKEESKYNVIMGKYLLNNKTSMGIYGQTMNVPFRAFTESEKDYIGKIILKTWFQNKNVR